MAAAGDEVGGFTLVRELGAGGMGSTWEAVRRAAHGFEQRVALKLANQDVLRGPEGLSLFRREAALAASLRHPNIASVLDVDEVRGYIVYELVDGADLRSVLREAPSSRFAPRLVVYVLNQLCRGLDHAHNRILHGQPSPVVHRDMSPGNVVVDYDGNLKIVDFGIAKPTAARERSETIKGKLSYMAPEQATGDDVDGRVDQYALGVMAYEMATSERPNDGAHDGETLANILNGTHTPITRLAPDIPAGLAEIIERMLALKRDDRFPSLAAVVDALERFRPLLSTHRELAELVRRAHPPQTIVLEDGRLVSRPVSDVAPRPSGAEAVRAPQGGAQARRALPPTETFAYRSDPLGTAATELAPASSAPGRTPSKSVSVPAPSELIPRRRARWQVPVALASVLAVAAIAWAALSPSSTPPAAPQTEAASATTAEAANPAASAAGTSVATAPASIANPAAPPLNAVQPAGPPPAAAAAGEPSAEPPVQPRADQPASDPERRQARRKPKPAASDLATLRVTVFPWGRVWIDGKLQGSVPPILNVKVPAGSHKVSVGQEQPAKSKTVEVDAGATTLVSFELD